MAKGGYRGGMPMGGRNQMQMMKQAQKMQQDLLKMQQEMEEKQYEATAGGGVITAVVSGKRELVRVTIDPEANSKRGEDIMISTPDSKVKVFVIPTNEELVIARDTKAICG